MEEKSASLKISYSSPLLQDPLLFDIIISGKFLAASQLTRPHTLPILGNVFT